MAIILHIETATPVCSVALGIDGQCVGFKEIEKENSHSSLVTVMIEQLLKDHNIITTQLQAIAVSKGPGSYTGLRIGASVAKGMCYALDIPLIAISTLESIAKGAQLGVNCNQNMLICPMIDARRQEVYTALFDEKMNRLTDDKPLILDEHSFVDTIAGKILILCGDGSKKAGEIMKTVPFIQSNTTASARWMVEIGEQMFKTQSFENTAYFAPFYLKEFITTTPRKR